MVSKDVEDRAILAVLGVFPLGEVAVFRPPGPGLGGEKMVVFSVPVPMSLISLKTELFWPILGDLATVTRSQLAYLCS